MVSSVQLNAAGDVLAGLTANDKFEDLSAALEGDLKP